MHFLTMLRTFHADQSGQDVVEYALVLAAMAFAVVAGSAGVANVMSNALTAINTKISGAIASIS
jgi:Flp pilus assembly pilin Flp